MINAIFIAATSYATTKLISKQKSWLYLIFLLLWKLVFVCMFGDMCMWVFIRSDAGVFFTCSPTYCFRQSLSMNLEDPEPDNSARLVDQKAPRILLSPRSFAGIVGECSCSKLRLLGVGDPSTHLRSVCY